MKRNILFAIVAVLFSCIACEPNTSVESVESISLNKASIQLNIGQTETLVATTSPTNTTVSWNSSNPTVAIVVDGVVTGLSNGTAVIVATAGNQLASCVVVVGNAEQSTTSINFNQYLEGSEYYVFLMDDKAMSRIKGTVYDYRVNGEYASPGKPADGVTATMDIWNSDVKDSNFGTCKGASAFGDTDVEWLFWKSGSMAWGNICGGIRQWGQCDFTTVTGDFNYVIIYRTPRMLAGTSVTVKLYSTAGGEHNVDRGMISQSRGEWDVAEWSMAELFADGLDWSKTVQGSLSNVVYSPALVVEGANREFEICAIFCYKK